MDHDNSPLVPAKRLHDASDASISDTITDLVAEQHRRALERNDIDAIAHEAFSQQITVRNAVPYLVNGLLVCPGVKVMSSRTSHDCVFASIDGVWAWEHPDAVYDRMVTTTIGSRQAQVSVTIVPAHDTMTVDAVTSKARSGPCRMSAVTSLLVTNNTLTKQSSRNTAPRAHR